MKRPSAMAFYFFVRAVHTYVRTTPREVKSNGFLVNLLSQEMFACMCGQMRAMQQENQIGKDK